MVDGAYLSKILWGRKLTLSRMKAAAESGDLRAMIQNSRPSEVIYSYAVGFDKVVDELLRGRAFSFNAAVGSALRTAQNWERDVAESYFACKAVMQASEPKLTLADAQFALSLATDLTWANFLKELFFTLGGGFLRTQTDAPIIARYLENVDRLDQFMEQQVYGPMWQGFLADKR